MRVEPPSRQERQGNAEFLPVFFKLQYAAGRKQLEFSFFGRHRVSFVSITPIIEENR
jgi:hypothetical protein